MFEQIKQKISDLAEELGVEISIEWRLDMPCSSERWARAGESFRISSISYETLFVYHIQHVLNLTVKDFVLQAEKES